MAFRYDKIFKGSSREKSNVIVGIDELASFFGTNDRSWATRDNLEQYSKSLYTFAAVNKIAKKVASIDLHLYKIINKEGDSDEILDHPALDLMWKINPFQTKTEFLRIAWINKTLTGEAFWLKVRNARGEVIELWNLRPDYMTIVADPTSYIKHYEFEKSDGKKEIFAPEDIIYFKDPNPTNPFRGQSPVSVAKQRIETEQEATKYQKNFFKNNARPDALLMTEETLDKEQKDQMTSTWEEKHQGSAASSRIGILEGGMKYQQVSISQKEMDFIESLKFTRGDILVALGVPESVIVSNASNFATADSDFRSFLSECIATEMAYLVEVLNEFMIGPDFGEELYLDFTDPTPADRAAQRADNTAGYGKWLTTNEIRATYNLPPVEGGDSIATQDAFSNLGDLVQASIDRQRKLKTIQVMRGRHMLKIKFEVESIIKSELPSVMKRKTSKKPISVKKLKKIKENDGINRVSIFPDSSSRSVYFELVNKRLDRRSSIFKDAIIDELGRQHKRITEKLNNLSDKKLEKLHKKISHSAVETLLDKKGEIKIMSTLALPFLLDFAKRGGEDAAKLTGEKFEMTAALKTAIDKRAGFFASSITNTTFKKLSSSLSQGISDGEGISELKARVENIYSDVPSWRAATIARTETTNANNEGAMEQFRISPVVSGKEWVATLDDSTRDSHADANGEIVGVDQYFSNGMKYPGDSSGGPEETVNCRCVLSPSLIGDE